MATKQATGTIPHIIDEGFLAALRAHGVVEAYVFGSRTRGEERPDSDLDLLVTFDPPISLLDQIGVAIQLSALCDCQVDLLTSLHPAFAPYIESTLVPIQWGTFHGDT